MKTLGIQLFPTAASNFLPLPFPWNNLFWSTRVLYALFSNSLIVICGFLAKAYFTNLIFKTIDYGIIHERFFYLKFDIRNKLFHLLRQAHCRPEYETYSIWRLGSERRNKPSGKLVSSGARRIYLSTKHIKMLNLDFLLYVMYFFMFHFT